MGKGKRPRKKNKRRKGSATVRKAGWDDYPPYSFRDWLFSYGSVILWFPIAILWPWGFLYWLYSPSQPGRTFISIASWILGFAASIIRTRVGAKLDRIFANPPAPENAPTIRRTFLWLFSLQWFVLLGLGTPVLVFYGWFDSLISLIGFTPGRAAELVAAVIYWVVSAIMSGILGNLATDFFKGLYYSRKKANTT